MVKNYTNLLFWIGFILLISFLGFLYQVLIKKLQQNHYKAKGPYLLSKGEKVFFDTLSQAVSSDIYICPKTRLADIIEVDLPKSNKSFWMAFNKISRKYVDFVLCKRTDFTPILVVELDGGSHQRNSRYQRDVFVDNALNQAGIPILHINAQRVYDVAQLQTAILNTLSNKNNLK